MKVNEFIFPILCLEEEFVRVETSYDSLVTTTKAAIKNGMFANIQIVDSEGNCIKVHNAKKISGSGFLWGYNLYFNQRIKVELITEGKPFKLSLEKIKSKTCDILNGNKEFWESGGNFKELLKNIRHSKTIPELFATIPD